MGKARTNCLPFTAIQISAKVLASSQVFTSNYAIRSVSKTNYKTDLLAHAG